MVQKVIIFFEDIIKNYIVLIILSLQSCQTQSDFENLLFCNFREYDYSAEEEWYVSYNGSGEESHGHFVLNVSDGGYIQIGETGFIPKSKILVIKTNYLGELQWKKEISNRGHNLGNSVLEISNGYLISSGINKNSSLILLNKQNGDVIYDYIFDNGGTDAFENMVVFGDTIAAVGYFDAEDQNNTFFTSGKGILSFINKNGKKLLDVDLSNHLSHAYRIKKVNDNLIISGLSENANDYSLIKLDYTGRIIWSKKYGGNNYDHNFGMDINSNNEIFLTGHTLSGTENWDTYTIKLDISGNILWESIIGNPRGFDSKYIHDEAWGVASTSDGGCIVVAGSGDEYKSYNKSCENYDQSSDQWIVYLIKYDKFGSIEWEKIYGNKNIGDLAGEDVDISDDGSIIVAVDDGGFGFLKLK